MAIRRCRDDDDVRIMEGILVRRTLRDSRRSRFLAGGFPALRRGCCRLDDGVLGDRAAVTPGRGWRYRLLEYLMFALLAGLSIAGLVVYFF